MGVQRLTDDHLQTLRKAAAFNLPMWQMAEMIGFSTSYVSRLCKEHGIITGFDGRSARRLKPRTQFRCTLHGLKFTDPREYPRFIQTRCAKGCVFQAEKEDRGGRSFDDVA